MTIRRTPARTPMTDESGPPSRRRALGTRLGMVAAAAVALAVLVPSTIAFAAGSSTAHQPASKPTVVLVHGAWADGSSWSGVVGRLQSRGYTVNVAPNPLRGLSEDSAYLKAYLATIPGSIVLVGHSYGGAVITNAATGNRNVKALVYDDAFIPAAGETVAELAGPASALAPASTDPTSVFSLVPYPGAPDGIYDTYLLPSVFVKAMAGDLPRSRARVLAASQSPASLLTVGEPSGTPAWKTIPSWDLVGLQDKVIPPAQQLTMAARAHSHVTKIASSHLSLVSHPAKVVDVIVKAAVATR
ncbi:alpha/beta hydrolase [Galbitalea sp. SE-J8]|uniref:alpha/beta fold hydrolase n=1 Tax=Galbitalea sp. SE-J8 TaxID=3054952 RepID=UPI00259C71D4|nr:alpha/beta hydrolase [Galbitalea sp. SE-J8]MDM4762601.1 alpha/beta hydrolase [Galbitalea sp. SE-J8]